MADYVVDLARNGWMAYEHQGYYFADQPKINPILKWKEKQPLKIGILGAQGTGKTTLAGELALELGTARIDEVARTVHGMGYTLNEQSDMTAQLLIWFGQLYEELDLPQFVADRTLLDVIVYSNYLKDNWSDTDRLMLTALENITFHLMKQYSALLYIPIEFNLVDDGIRAMDSYFQLEIDQLFKKYLAAFQLEYIPIRGNRIERVNASLKYLRELGLTDSPE